MKTHIDRFLSLRCAGDVLESIQPVSGDITRKIFESMAVIEAIRPLTLRERGKWKIVEICSGAPLISVIAAHLLPVETVKAYCWRGGLLDRDRALGRVKHLSMRYDDYEMSVSELWTEVKHGDSIVVSASAPFEIAESVAINCGDIGAPMALIPGRSHVALHGAAEKMIAELTGDNHRGWLYRLGKFAHGEVKILFDVDIDDKTYFSPIGYNNGIVTRGLRKEKGRSVGMTYEEA